MTTVQRVWRSRLIDEGFKPVSTGGRRGTYCIRKVGVITLGIGVLVDKEHRDGRFNVQLNINLPLPASQPPHDVVALLADLSHKRVRIQQTWEHVSDFETWWEKGDVESSWEAFQLFGLQWLENFGDLEQLIAYFEGEYLRYSAIHRKISDGGIINRALLRTGLRPRPVPPPYEDFLLWQAILYEQVPNKRKALDLLMSYEKLIKRRGVNQELERIARHKALLS